MQTSPPSVPIAAFFPSGVYPEGELQQYRDECAPPPARAQRACWRGTRAAGAVAAQAR